MDSGRLDAGKERLFDDIVFSYGIGRGIDDGWLSPLVSKAGATEIAENSPLGLVATRKTVRGDLADRVRAATDRELAEQTWLRKTDDFKEGVKATAERRVPNFTGK